MELMGSIILDEFGATLLPRVEDGTKWVENYLGKHAGCQHPTGSIGHMAAVFHSESHSAVFCHQCHLRIMVPHTVLPLVVTPAIFEPLQKWCAQQIESKKQLIPLALVEEGERVLL